MYNPQDYPDLLVGLESPDDAAVWQLDETRALVVTTDFFTPVVDTPYEYGAIAAANSLSDIYAMGGTPFLALNIAALPPQLDTSVLAEIVRGSAEKTREAGAVIAGGHTVQDKEPKVGLVALGFADPRQILTKRSAQPGDVLVLSKPLGFGVTTTALKREQADSEDVAEVVQWMSRLNRDAGRLATTHGLRAATDITGFSLLGHGLEMAAASGVGFRLSFSRIPFVTCARKYAAMWTFPGGASDNRLFFGSSVHFDPSLSEAEQMLLFDPQTSGGLLMSVPSGKIDALMKNADQIGQPVWIIGEVVQEAGVHVIP